MDGGAQVIYAVGHNYGIQGRRGSLYRLIKRVVLDLGYRENGFRAIPSDGELHDLDELLGRIG